MELTEEQKRMVNSPEYWEDVEERKKQIEYWNKHPLTREEILEQMNNRKDFIRSSYPVKSVRNREKDK